MCGRATSRRRSRRPVRQDDAPARQEPPVEGVLLVEHPTRGERVDGGLARPDPAGRGGRVRQRGQDGSGQGGGILRRDEEPVDAVRQDVGDAATAVATTGAPTARASRTIRGRPSRSEVVDDVGGPRMAGTSLRRPRKAMRPASPAAATACSAEAARGPSPTIQATASGRVGGARERVDEHERGLRGTQPLHEADDGPRVQHPLRGPERATRPGRRAGRPPRGRCLSGSRGLPARDRGRRQHAEHHALGEILLRTRTRVALARPVARAARAGRRAAGGGPRRC